MIVLFPETYEPGPASVEWQPSIGMGIHNSADGGLAIMSAWILRDEFCATTYAEQKKLIMDATPIKGRTAFETGKVDSPRFDFIEDGFAPRRTRWAMRWGCRTTSATATTSCFKASAICRSIIFPPPRKNAPQVSKENARLLGVSRYLVPETDRTDNTPPSAQLVFRLSKGRPPKLMISIKATDDRELREAVFYDRQHDTVLGGTELAGKNQALEFATPGYQAAGRARSVRLAVTPRSAAGQGGGRILTLLADASGNIVYIASPIASP